MRSALQSSDCLLRHGPHRISSTGGSDSMTSKSYGKEGNYYNSTQIRLALVASDYSPGVGGLEVRERASFPTARAIRSSLGRFNIGRDKSNALRNSHPRSHPARVEACTQRISER